MQSAQKSSTRLVEYRRFSMRHRSRRRRLALLGLTTVVALGGCPQSGNSPGSPRDPNPTQYYDLTIQVVGQGAVLPFGEGTSSHAGGTVLNIYAEAYEGWDFSHWEGDVDSVASHLEVAMNSHVTVRATFTEQEGGAADEIPADGVDPLDDPVFWTLTVDVEGEGYVDVDPPGPYQAGDATEYRVAVTPTPTACWRFLEWRGDHVERDDFATIGSGHVYVSGNRHITAVFEYKDSDSDGTPDCNDECPNDPNKTSAGECGCGTPETDSDDDGTPDCNDECPDDPNKTSRGMCGCGNPETDEWSDVLTVAIEPDDGGTVQSEIVAQGSSSWKVSLTPQAGDGLRFSHWRFANEGTSEHVPYERWIYACGTADEITAVFVDSAITVNVAQQPASAGEVKLWMDGEEIPLQPGGNTLEYGDAISLEAVDAGVYTFHHWTVNDTDHYANPLEIDLEENLDVTAVFNAQPPTIHNLDARDFEPYVVIFSMRLRDGGGHAIWQGVTRDMFTIEERLHGQGEDEYDEISVETAKFVTPGKQLPLKVVLVLDYTDSMKQAGHVNTMAQVAKEQVIASPSFTGAHHMGCVEFHGDGDSEFSELAPLRRMDPAGKQDLADRILDESDYNFGFTAGLTRLWDAVNLALDMLEQTQPESGEVWSIIFMTDGWDTSSKRDPEGDLFRQRVMNQIHNGLDIVLYPVGFNPRDDHKAVLESLANDTHGLYHEWTNADELQQIFAQIVQDLAGQWDLTYITEKRAGAIDARVTFDYLGGTDSFTHSFDVTEPSEQTVNTGVIHIVERTAGDRPNSTKFLLSAFYMPRSINRLKFQLAGHTGIGFNVWEAADGGVLDGWAVTDDSVIDIRELGGPELEIGTHGFMCEITVDGDPAATNLNIVSDDLIYADPDKPNEPHRWIRFENHYAP